MKKLKKFAGYFVISIPVILPFVAYAVIVGISEAAFAFCFSVGATAFAVCCVYFGSKLTEN